MDMASLNSVATRRKMTAEVEKLREKVSKENKKIIKLKVAQDTAYWDLKEKLRQVETNHEKLQQNMLEVQMQYETVSTQYQDEKTQRVEVKSKFASNREVCQVLQDYSERLRETISRCKADQAALYEAYQQTGQVIRELKAQQIQQEESSRRTIDGLQDKLKQTTDFHNQLQKIFTEEKQRMTAELQEEKKKITSVLGKNNELLAANTELGALVDYSRRELEKKEENISSLQNDMKQLIQRFNAEANEMKISMSKTEKDLKESTAENESLKQALKNQEDFTKTVCDQKNQLLDKVAALEEEKAKAENANKDMEINLKAIEATKENIEFQIRAMEAKIGQFVKEISNKDEIISKSEMELQKATDQLAAMSLEKSEVLGALNKATGEAQALVAKVEELTESGMAMESKIQEIEDSMKAYHDAAEIKIKEMTLTIEEKDKDLASKTSSITQLINQIKNISDSNANLETTIQKLRQDLANEKDAAGEREKTLEMRIEQLDITVRDKDNELSKNLAVILELRADKERLNEKIQGMQNKIDKVQKELTGPAHVHHRIEPEQDDNAVMFAPTPKKAQPPPSRAQMAEPGMMAAPPKAPHEDFLFNFMSDGSDNTLDASFVNRRFEAMTRGEPLSPLPPLSTLKRRRTAEGMPAAQGGLRYKQPARDQNINSSQNKPRSFFKTKRHDVKSRKN